MNGAWSDADRLRNLIGSLEAQREPDGGDRGELLASLYRLVLGTAVPGDRTVDAVVDLVSNSSLGDCTLDDPVPADDGCAGPREVASVLDRLDRAAGRVPATAVDDDPVHAWSREFRRVLDGHPALVPASPSELLTDDGEQVARDLVAAAGQDWSGSGFEGLFRAARRHHAPGSMRTLRMCGLPGADTIDREAARVRLEDPVDSLPVVRGRDRTIADLVTAVRSWPVRAHVLVGPAGYGKTTVALAAARRLQTVRMYALCVPAGDLDELVDGLALAAVRTGATLQQLDAALRGDPATRARRLWELLDRSPTPWTIVLDAAGEQAVGDPAWTHRSRTGAVIVTTRFGDGRAWGEAARVLRIGRVRPEPGGQIVLDRLGTRPDLAARAAQDQARLLARRLGGVPLALRSAGRLVAGSRPGAGALQEVAHELAAITTDDPVSAIYEIGVRGGDLRETVRLLSCFAANRPLPVAVLDAGPDLVPRLVRTGLVDEQLDREHTITIHPGIAELSRRDAVIDAGVVDRRAIALLRRRVADLDPGVFANRPSLRMLEPHVSELVASPALGTGRLLVEALELAGRTAEALVRCGHQRAAETLLAAALERAALLDAHHPAVLALRHTRARTAALDGGDYTLAERELVDVLALRTRVLGVRHHDTLSTRDCLAWVSAERGVPEDAREEIAAVLTARTEVLGRDHPDTLATRHRLGWVDVQLGRRAEAVADLMEVLLLRRRVLGPDHLDVASTRYRLAWAMVKVHRYAEAEDAFRDLQDDLEATAGWRHPMTLMVRVRVGWVLLRRGLLAEAEEHLNDVLADQVTVLGADHRRVLRTRHLLACVVLRRGAPRKALREFDDVVALRTGLLGADHPDTLDSRAHQAWALLHAGNAEVADRGFQAVVADRQRVQGPLNTDTLKMRCLAARARMLRGRLGEAQHLLARLQDDVVSVLPAGHALVFDVRHTLAVVHGLRGRFATAQQELRAIVDDRTLAFGPDHRDTLAAGDYLAWILGREGRFSEAFETATSVLDTRARLLGPRHVHTLTSRYRLAWLTLGDGDHRAASALFDRLLDDVAATLGPEHPDTLRCRHARARLRRRSGDHGGAAAIASGVLHDQLEIQGPDAVDTLRAAEEMGLALRGMKGRERDGAVLLDEVMRHRDAVMGQDHPDNIRLRGELRGWS